MTARDVDKRLLRDRITCVVLWYGAVAQRESTSLARKGSGVQIASAPPLSQNVGIWHISFFVLEDREGFLFYDASNTYLKIGAEFQPRRGAICKLNAAQLIIKGHDDRS